ncbi:MAG TPA: DUF2948 family protein [Rhizomicrobium sp.]|jgi:hypothetical protein|nr:DUF2948 family protein [Rhizomicrobium sp.]
MTRLKLAAVDAEDLEVLSARLQDAVAKLKNVIWLPKKRRFAALVNRLQWEAGGKTRVKSGLHFDGVLKVQSQQVKLGAGEAVVDILAVTFAPNRAQEGGGEDPGGVIEIVLAGGGAIRLTVECIDAELADVTGPWAAQGTPDHEGPAQGTTDHEVL